MYGEMDQPRRREDEVNEERYRTAAVDRSVEKKMGTTRAHMFNFSFPITKHSQETIHDFQTSSSSQVYPIASPSPSELVRLCVFHVVGHDCLMCGW
jgi:hypothetical protein